MENKYNTIKIYNDKLSELDCSIIFFHKKLSKLKKQKEGLIKNKLNLIKNKYKILYRIQTNKSVCYGCFTSKRKAIKYLPTDNMTINNNGNIVNYNIIVENVDNINNNNLLSINKIPTNYPYTGWIDKL